MAPLVEVNQCGCVREENVLASVSEGVYLDQAQIAAEIFIEEGGLEARYGPTRFGMWSYEASGYKPVLIIELSTDVDEGIKEAMDELVRNKPRSEAEAHEFVLQEIPFLCGTKKDRLGLVLPEEALRRAMEYGFIPVSEENRERLAELPTHEFWQIVAQGEPAAFFGLGETTRESILKSL